MGTFCGRPTWGGGGKGGGLLSSQPAGWPDTRRLLLSWLTHGAGRQVVADMLVRMRRELGAEDSPIPPEIDQLILIDRSVVRRLAVQ
jgi:hypothetical protein